MFFGADVQQSGHVNSLRTTLLTAQGWNCFTMAQAVHACTCMYNKPCSEQFLLNQCGYFSTHPRKFAIFFCHFTIHFQHRTRTRTRPKHCSKCICMTVRRGLLLKKCVAYRQQFSHHWVYGMGDRPGQTTFLNWRSFVSKLDFDGPIVILLRWAVCVHKLGIQLCSNNNNNALFGWI